MYKGIKIRIYPDEEQEWLIYNNINCSRVVFNHFLNRRIDEYQLNGKILNLYEMQKELTKYKRKHPYMKKADSEALIFALRDLDTAYRLFFRSGKGYPKFKGKSPYGSYRIQNSKALNGVALEDGLIYLRKLGWVRIKNNYQLKPEEVIKQATISRLTTGEYFATLLIKFPDTVQTAQGDKIIVLRLDDIKFELETNKIRRSQRKLARMEKGSNNYKQKKNKTSKMYAHQINCRLDYYHKLTKRLAEEYDVIIAEKQSTTESKRYAWNKFCKLLEYKATLQGKTFILSDDTEQALKELKSQPAAHGLSPVCHLVLTQTLSRN